MKDRVLTFALALAAFAAFYALLAPKVEGPQEHVTRPISTEQGANGYAALERWLAAQGVKTLSLRERYQKLPDLTQAAPTGNLIISTAPHIYPVRDAEAATLRSWIAQGNTLLLVAGLSDTPEWSVGEGADRDFMNRMYALTSLRFLEILTDQSVPTAKSAAGTDAERVPQQRTARDAAEALRKLIEPLQFESKPRGPHPLLEGVGSVAAISEYPTAQWRAIAQPHQLLLELAHDPNTDAPTLWLLPYGSGQIILSAYGSIFTNKLLGQQDNAQLLANIIEWSRHGAGQVIIDDAHQGLVAFYDPQAFFGDARLHRSLWWLLGLWLVFVLGPQRLRAAGSRWNPLDINSFVRATGGFMARVLRPAAAAQQLFANFFNDLRRRLGLPVDGTPVWEWIGAQATVPAGELAQLRDLHAKALQGRRIDLPKLHNLLVQVRARVK